MKNTVILLALLACVSISQRQLSDPSLHGIWELQPPEGIFKIYTDSMKTYNMVAQGDGDFFIDEEIYGYYRNCNPDHIDSLRATGTGEFFFQLSPNGLDIGETGMLNQRLIKCFSIRIEANPDDTLLLFGRSSVATYKKVTQLPEDLARYLKEQEPKIYNICERLLK